MLLTMRPPQPEANGTCVYHRVPRSLRSYHKSCIEPRPKTAPSVPDDVLREILDRVDDNATRARLAAVNRSFHAWTLYRTVVLVTSTEIRSFELAASRGRVRGVRSLSLSSLFDFMRLEHLAQHLGPELRNLHVPPHALPYLHNLPSITHVTVQVTSTLPLRAIAAAPPALQVTHLCVLAHDQHLCNQMAYCAPHIFPRLTHLAYALEERLELYALPHALQHLHLHLAPAGMPHLQRVLVRKVWPLYYHPWYDRGEEVWREAVKQSVRGMRIQDRRVFVDAAVSVDEMGAGRKPGVGSDPRLEHMKPGSTLWGAHALGILDMWLLGEVLES